MSKNILTKNLVTFKRKDGVKGYLRYKNYFCYKVTLDMKPLNEKL